MELDESDEISEITMRLDSFIIRENGEVEKEDLDMDDELKKKAINPDLVHIPNKSIEEFCNSMKKKEKRKMRINLKHEWVNYTLNWMAKTIISTTPESPEEKYSHVMERLFEHPENVYECIALVLFKVDREIKRTDKMLNDRHLFHIEKNKGVSIFFTFTSAWPFYYEETLSCSKSLK